MNQPDEHWVMPTTPMDEATMVHLTIVAKVGDEMKTFDAVASTSGGPWHMLTAMLGSSCHGLVLDVSNWADEHR